VDVTFFRTWIEEIAREVETHRDHLTHLDAAIGDADHGTTWPVASRLSSLRWKRTSRRHLVHC
jgi:dihydroxyacetone kinase